MKLHFKNLIIKLPIEENMHNNMIHIAIKNINLKYFIKINLKKMPGIE